MSELANLLGAVHFAADKHRDRRRKGASGSPCINHPIAVAEILAREGDVTDLVTLRAAVLHDTVEDTDTTSEEIERLFGPSVRAVVDEMTGDKSLPEEERERLQVEHAPWLSRRAKEIQLGDMLCNLRDVALDSPIGWPLERRMEYLEWSALVVDGCRGANLALERCFDELLASAESLDRCRSRVTEVCERP